MANLKYSEDLENLREKIISQRDPQRKCVTICSGTWCRAYRSEDVSNAFAHEIETQGL